MDSEWRQMGGGKRQEFQSFQDNFKRLGETSPVDGKIGKTTNDH